MFGLDSDNGSQKEESADSELKSTIQGDRIIFHHLPSYKFDQKLKADVDDNIYSKYYNGVYYLSRTFPWITDIFKKLSRNIPLIHESYIDGDDFNRKRCYDLNFWLYDQVYKNLESSKQNTQHIGDIVDNLQEVWKNIVDKEFPNEGYKCYPDKELLLNMSYLQEVKDLLDFFEDYNEMKKEIIANTYKSCFKYVDYLRQRIPVYYAWRDSCKVDSFACKRYIDDYMKYRPTSVVNDLSYFGVILTYYGNECYSNVYDIFVAAKEKPKRNDAIYKQKFEDLKRENGGQNLLNTRLGDWLRGSKYYIPGDNDDYNYQMSLRHLDDPFYEHEQK
ncbi:VIR protein [Plasmodium vivax]|uniref:VIR protein n=1 Tax=Plasmodium vivax TaxID=5855 RepID=A0A1G4E6B7_PLAVI|nr:VIR protein [Plasmodium vivax]